MSTVNIFQKESYPHQEGKVVFHSMFAMYMHHTLTLFTLLHRLQSIPQRIKNNVTFSAPI